MTVAYYRLVDVSGLSVFKLVITVCILNDVTRGSSRSAQNSFIKERCENRTAGKGVRRQPLLKEFTARNPKMGRRKCCAGRAKSCICICASVDQKRETIGAHNGVVAQMFVFLV